MTELQIVPTLPSVEGEVTHVPSALARPLVVLKAVIGGVEQTWYVYGEDDEDVAHRLPRVHRYIQELRKKFGGADMPQPGTSVHDDAKGHDCEWHGPMRESTKAPGTWFCPKRMASGAFCGSRWPVRAGDKVS